MSARETILSNIRKAREKAGLPASDPAAVTARLEAHTPNLIPALGQAEGEARVEQFVTKLTELGGTTKLLDSEADITAAVADYLKENNQPNSVLIAEENDLGALDWSQAPMLDVHKGFAKPREATVLTRTFAGIAETGSLVVQSNRANPPGNMFLPENHVAILHTGQIEGSLEDVWARLRTARSGENKPMPRSVNMISGPSRTADINATMYMGAHGPKRLHVLIIRD